MLIQLWTEDLFWLPRLQDAAGSLGYILEHVQSPADLDAAGDFVDRPIPLTEPLEGPDAKFVQHLSEVQPALLIVDLNSDAIPWARWIQVIKTSAAVRRIPVLAFGPHIEKQNLEKARAAGADAVVSRGKFQNSLTDLIEQWARPSIVGELAAACEGELSAHAVKGINFHNQIEFYKAHEELELAWMEAPEHEGYLYRALLQITVAYLHLKRGNLRGATKMLLRVHQWLDPLPVVCRSLDVQNLREHANQLRLMIENTDSITDLPELEELFKPFPLIEGNS